MLERKLRAKFLAKADLDQVVSSNSVLIGGKIAKSIQKAVVMLINNQFQLTQLLMILILLFKIIEILRFA